MWSSMIAFQDRLRTTLTGTPRKFHNDFSGQLETKSQMRRSWRLNRGSTWDPAVEIGTSWEITCGTPRVQAGARAEPAPCLRDSHGRMDAWHGVSDGLGNKSPAAHGSTFPAGYIGQPSPLA